MKKTLLIILTIIVLLYIFNKQFRQRVTNWKQQSFSDYEKRLQDAMLMIKENPDLNKLTRIRASESGRDFEDQLRLDAADYLVTTQ